MKSLNLLMDEIHVNAINKEFWEPCVTQKERVLQEATAISLIGSEAMEALEAHRNNDVPNLREELADIIIMTLSVAAHLDIDIEMEIAKKMQINASRPPKHGKRY